MILIIWISGMANIWLIYFLLRKIAEAKEFKKLYYIANRMYLKLGAEKENMILVCTGENKYEFKSK